MSPKRLEADDVSDSRETAAVVVVVVAVAGGHVSLSLSLSLRPAFAATQSCTLLLYYFVLARPITFALPAAAAAATVVSGITLVVNLPPLPSSS